MYRVKTGFSNGAADGFLYQLEEKIYASTTEGSKKFNSHIDPVELLELGTAYTYQGKFKKSNEVLEEAYQIYNTQEERAFISLSAVSTQIGESTVTAGTGNYQLANYEKVFLHSLKAVNFLMQGAPDTARVEIERAYLRQKLIKKQSENKFTRAKSSYNRKILKAKRKTGRRSSATIEETFDANRMIAKGQLSSSALQSIRNIRSSYENAFTEVLSSLVYGLNDELGNSLPPLKRAVEISNNPFVRRNKIRRENLQNGRISLVKDNFYLFVFTGYAPEKQKRSWILTNPWTGAINKISYAKPTLQPSATTRVDLLDEKGNLIDSVPLLSRVSALALKDYDEKLPLMAMKSMSRLIVQSIKDAKLREKMGDWGALLGSAMNLILENADLRTWTLLPDKVLFYSGNIKASRVTISANQGRLKKAFRREVPINPDRETVVFVRAFDNSIRVFYKGF